MCPRARRDGFPACLQSLLRVGGAKHAREAHTHQRHGLRQLCQRGLHRVPWREVRGQLARSSHRRDLISWRAAALRLAGLQKGRKCT